MNKQAEINVLKQFLIGELLVDKHSADNFESFLVKHKIPYKYLKNNWRYFTSTKPMIVFEEVENGVKIYLNLFYI